MEGVSRRRGGRGVVETMVAYIETVGGREGDGREAEGREGEGREGKVIFAHLVAKILAEEFTITYGKLLMVPRRKNATCARARAVKERSTHGMHALRAPNMCSHNRIMQRPLPFKWLRRCDRSLTQFA